MSAKPPSEVTRTIDNLIARVDKLQHQVEQTITGLLARIDALQQRMDANDSHAQPYVLDLLEAIESENYSCEAGLLENNIAWRELKRLAKGG